MLNFQHTPLVETEPEHKRFLTKKEKKQPFLVSGGDVRRGIKIQKRNNGSCRRTAPSVLVVDVLWTPRRRGAPPAATRYFFFEF